MGSTRRARVLAAAALAGALVLPAARAQGANSMLEIPGMLSGAQVLDLDGDGARDLLLVEADPHVRVAWWAIESGRPVEVSTVELFPDASSHDAASLRVVRSAGASRALLLLHTQDASTGRACCTVGFWIDGIRDRLVASPFESIIPDDAETFIAVDIDGDGSDELLAVGGGFEEDTERHVSVLRFTEGLLEPAVAPISVSTQIGWSMPGDSDGMPGAEVIFGPDQAGRLVRIGAAGDGEVRVERASLAAPNPLEGAWVAGAISGQLLIQDGERLRVGSWPAYGTPSAGAFVEGLWSMSGPITLPGGSSVLLATPMANERELIVLDADLVELGRIEIPAPSDWWALSERYRALEQLEPLLPSWGPLGRVGQHGVGWLLSGSLITVPDSGVPEVLVGGGLVGVAPVGSMGPHDAWIVLTRRSWGGLGEFEPLMASPSQESDGVVIVPFEELVAPGSAGRVRLAGTAVPLGAGHAATAEATVSFDVEAAGGSRIIGLLNGDVVFDERATHGVTRLAMVASGRDADDPTMEALVMVATPIGRWSASTWTIDVMRDAPDLVVSGATATARFASRVTGVTEPGALVEVDGRPVTVAVDGSFDVTVDATPWPRDVRVVATSVVGRESATVVSVIGLYDWRWLPWPLLVAAAMALLGVALYLTAGRWRPPAPAVDGDGTWEEFDAAGSARWEDAARRAARADPDRRS